MQPRILRLHSSTIKKLLRTKKESEIDGCYRVAKRIHAVLLSNDQKTSGEISNILKTPRSCVSKWIANYEKYGYDSLLEGYRKGRPASLTDKQKIELADIVDSGPMSYGFMSGVWTSIMIAQVILNEFSVEYDPRHVRRILDELNFSIQRPKKFLIKADPQKQNRWIRYLYPNIKKKAMDIGSIIVFEDEASFRQDSTMHATWSRRGNQPLMPVTGARKSVKVYGCVELVSAKFTYQMTEESFNAETYIESFLQKSIIKNTFLTFKIMHRTIKIQKFGNGLEIIEVGLRYIIYRNILQN